MQFKATFAVLLVVLAHTRANKKCCQNIGCFNNTSGPMKDFPAPNCPEDIGIKFYLFTRENPEYEDRVEMSQDNSHSLFDPNKQTIWTAHGYFGKSDAEWANMFRAALFEREDVNVVSVDWSAGSDTINYPKAAATTETVGAAMAHVMQGLVDNHNASYDNMWCVGFSLGAHVCGHAGMRTDGQIARVTGLDPAGPWFHGGDVRNGINPSSGQFVDVIHTDGTGTFYHMGLLEPRGHVDFYPNGGSYQRGCRFGRRKRALTSKVQGQNAAEDKERSDFTGAMTLEASPYNYFVGCSHFRAPYLFIETFTHKGCHVATKKCTDYNDIPGTCTTIEPTKMGRYADENVHKEGLFYLQTERKRPYCRYH